MKARPGLLRSFAVLLAVSAALSASAQNHVVISQVYGGGGNSGATYTNDFIELYNPTSAAVDISGYSIQYASGTGSSWNQFNFPTGATIQSHHYYLIKAAAGTTPAQNFTADFDISSATTSDDGLTFTINLSATAGKVALVGNHTALAGTTAAAAAPLSGATCPATNAAAIVDLVGYGTATCSEGGTTATAPPSSATNSTSMTRDGNGDDTNVNGADFTTLTPPNPRNSTYSATALAIASTSAAAATPGNQSLLSVTVTPGSTSTGIAVTANLTQIGGSATQTLALSSTANLYTYVATIGASIAANTYQLPVTVTDQQGGSVSGTISLTVQPLVVTTPISTLQSNRSTYAGTNVTTTGVVTLITNAGFFIQTPSSNPGSTGAAEGVYVYAGTGKVPATAAIGNSVQVTGALAIYPAVTASHTPSLEIESPAVTVLATNQTLPAPIQLSAASLTPTGGIYQLTKYEGMRVTVPSLTAVSATDGTLTESSETIVSSGQFYAVMTGVARPFREPGMDFRDFPAATCPSLANCTATATSAGVARPANLVLYDDNPERLIVESSLGGGTPLDVTAGAVITNVTGVIDFSYATDVPYGDPARLILQPGTVTSANYTPGISVVPLAVPGGNQFTVAAFNIERFYNTNSADDLYYDPVAGQTKKSLAVDVTADAYARRLKKVSLAIRTVLNNPDIISVEECENVSVLKDIAAQIDADTTGTKPGYAAYGTDSATTFTNDVSGISVGFLVKSSTVDVVNFQQMGATSTFQASTGTQTLNDRPSDVLHAGIKRGSGAKDYPITVISNHLRSLDGIGTSADTRLKKELQAEMLANLIQGYQSNGEHVLAVGDMNAFQFSDGYTDTLGTITGRTADPSTVVQAGKPNLVTPAATDLVTLLPAAQQQSYTEFGNAQVLDHIVATADLVSSTTLAYAHLDADFPLIDYNDGTTPARTSDHDAAVAYVNIPAPVISGTLTGTGTFPQEPVGTASAGQVFTLTNTGEAPITVTAFTVTGDFAQTNNCGSSLTVGSSCAVNVVFKPTAAGARTGSLALNGNATIAAVTLTGTGLAPDFSIGDSTGSSTTNLTVTAGSTATLTLTLKPVNNFSGTVTFTCTPAGTAPKGVVCSVTNSVALSGTQSSTVSVALSTSPRVFTGGLAVFPRDGAGRLLGAALLAIMLGALGSMRRYRNLFRVVTVAMLLLCAAAGISGCTSSGTDTNPNGTAAGTYTYNITATSGTITHTETIALTVK